MGEVNGRPFVNNASFGAYAEVVQSPEYRDDKTQTTLRQLPDLLLGHAGARLSARAGQVGIEAPQAVLVSNNPYGTSDPAGMGRRSRLDLGTLGVFGLRVDNAVQAAGLLRGAASRGVTITSAPEVTVTADAAEIPVGVDGEALMLRTPVRCVSRPGALRVRVPRNRPGLRTARPPLDWHRVRDLAGGLFHRAARRSPHGGASASNTATPSAGGLMARPAGASRAARRPPHTGALRPRLSESAGTGRVGPVPLQDHRHRTDALARYGPGPHVQRRQPFETLARLRRRVGHSRRRSRPACGTARRSQCRCNLHGQQHLGQVDAPPAATRPRRRGGSAGHAGYQCPRRGRFRRDTARRRSRSPQPSAPTSHRYRSHCTWARRSSPTRGCTPACTIPVTLSPAPARHRDRRHRRMVSSTMGRETDTHAVKSRKSPIGRSTPLVGARL